MSIDAPPDGPSVEELERLVGDPFKPKDNLCHWPDAKRPGYRLCGMRSPVAVSKHESGSLFSIMETGYCRCGRAKCPTCLRIYLFRRVDWSKPKKRWWQR